MFTKVTYNNTMKDIPARVNRVTGELQINPALWSTLTGDYKDYILYHEEGHLVLQTKDEAEANRYALNKFIKVAELNDAETARRIVVLTEITNPLKTRAFGGANRPEAPDDESNFAALDIIGGVLGQVDSILKTTGVGSKTRIKEAAQAAEINANTAAAAAAALQKQILIGGTLLLVILVLYFTLK